jgi:membrane protein implicated in regulation of membrane protease activity
LVPVTESFLILIIVLDTIGSLFIGAWLGRLLTRYPFGAAGFTGVESMINRRGEVKTASPERIEVVVDSQVWAASTLDPNEKLEPGDKVIVKDVDGLKLIVQKRD